MPADSHAHLSDKWCQDLDGVIKRAREAELSAIINSCIIPEFYSKSIEDSKKYSELHVALGYSPAYVHKLDWITALKSIEALHSKTVAIGEIGLDYHWIQDPKIREQQRKTFEEIIEVANRLKKPIFIHSRKAEEDSLLILKKKAQTLVILHCFAGTIEQAKEAVDLGWLISIPTAVTNRKKHRKIANRVPLENLIVETDAPFLNPVPYIEPKAQNEPANVIYAIKEIAKIKEIQEEEVDRITTKNCFDIIKNRR